MGLQSTVTSLGALFPASCVAGGLAVWCWTRLRPLMAAVFVVAFGGAVGVAVLLKLLADAYLPPLTGADPWMLSQGAPSGHTVGASVVYGSAAALFARLWKGPAAWLGTCYCLSVIAVVAMTRVSLHAHTAADAGAGIVVGLAFAALFDRAVKMQAKAVQASPLGLLALLIGIGAIALASGLRISSTHFI